MVVKVPVHSSPEYSNKCESVAKVIVQLSFLKGTVNAHNSNNIIPIINVISSTVSFNELIQLEKEMIENSIAGITNPNSVVC